MPINHLAPLPLSSWGQILSDHPALLFAASTGQRLAGQLPLWDRDALALIERLTRVIWRALGAIQSQWRVDLDVDGSLGLAALTGNWRDLWLLALRTPTPTAGVPLTLAAGVAAILDGAERDQALGRAVAADAWFIAIDAILGGLSEGTPV